MVTPEEITCTPYIQIEKNFYIILCDKVIGMSLQFHPHHGLPSSLAIAFPIPICSVVVNLCIVIPLSHIP